MSSGAGETHPHRYQPVHRLAQWRSQRGADPRSGLCPAPERGGRDGAAGRRHDGALAETPVLVLVLVLRAGAAGEALGGGDVGGVVRGTILRTVRHMVLAPLGLLRAMAAALLLKSCALALSWACTPPSSPPKR